jgi:hypothetical protein
MFRPIRLIFLLFCGWLAASVALAQDYSATSSQPSDSQSGQGAYSPPAREPFPDSGRDVKLFRLNFADAGLVVEQLYRLFPSGDVRIVADKRTNSVIVAAPSLTEPKVATLIAKLDVRQSQAESRSVLGEVKPETIPGRKGSLDRVVKSLDRLVATPQVIGQGSNIAVVRASPATQRALETMFLPPAGPQDRGQYRVLKPPSDDLNPAPRPADSIEVLRLSGQQAVAVRKALAEALSAESANRHVIIVLPPRAAGEETPPAGADSAPTLR